MPVPEIHPDHRREGALLNAALELAASERGLFLDRECGADPALRQRLERLLRAFEAAASFLEESVLPRPQGGVPPADTPLESEGPAERIGRYRLLEKLGEGGFGVVWMAEQDEPVRRRVALKLLKPGMDSRSIIARFGAERQALAMMDHPNIAKVLDAGAEGPDQETGSSKASTAPSAGAQGGWKPGVSGRPFFVMELVRGIRIRNWFEERCAGLSNEPVVDWIDTPGPAPPKD